MNYEAVMPRGDDSGSRVETKSHNASDTKKSGIGCVNVRSVYMYIRKLLHHGNANKLDHARNVQLRFAKVEYRLRHDLRIRVAPDYPLTAHPDFNL